MIPRTRVAPSPTGDPHVGTAYVALFNYCLARRHGGQFLLRIEDTDRQRSTARSEAAIVASLRWLGLDWDEGPDVGGPHGPYRQSDARELYGSHATDLVRRGAAFRCFCTPQRLDTVRQQQQQAGQRTGYDGHCAGLDPDEADRRAARGEAHVIRLRVPPDGEASFVDRLRGTITIPFAQVDMQVLLKTDGMPTYHLAAVVDDHRMGITHILRGEEWINSVPKHVLLYQAFGWSMPAMYHLPLLRNPDKTKLSKRRNPTSIDYYRKVGVLPEALLNYLGLMGFSLPDEREKFSLAEMVAEFDPDRISLGGPIFDQQKLAWLNGQWIRGLEPAEFDRRVHRWFLEETPLLQLGPLLQGRVDRLDQVAAHAEYLVGATAAYDADGLLAGQEREQVLATLQFALWRLESLDGGWTRAAIETALTGLAEALGMPIRTFLAPLFIAVSGRKVALPLFDSIELLGPDVARVRLRAAIDLLGGVGKKVQKRLERQFAELGGASVDTPEVDA